MQRNERKDKYKKKMQKKKRTTHLQTERPTSVCVCVCVPGSSITSSGVIDMTIRGIILAFTPFDIVNYMISNLT